MMKYELVVFDLDGTLITHDFQLLPSTLEAVFKLHEAGYRVTVATGRNYQKAKPYLDQMKIVEPMVFSNGAVFDNPTTGMREVLAGIPLETALIVFMLLREFSLSLKVHLADGTIYKSAGSVPWLDEGKEFESGTIVDNLAAEVQEDPLKIVFFDDDDKKIQAFEERLRSILGNKAFFRLFRSHRSFVEMTHHKVSKGSALNKLVQLLGIAPEEVITVGDQNNDLEMLRDFGYGVVSGKGTPELLQVCQRQIPSPEEGGIEQLVEWLLEEK